MNIRARASDPQLRSAAPVLEPEIAVGRDDEPARHPRKIERIRDAELERRIDELLFPRAPADVGSGGVLQLGAHGEIPPEIPAQEAEIDSDAEARDAGDLIVADDLDARARGAEAHGLRVRHEHRDVVRALERKILVIEIDVLALLGFEAVVAVRVADHARRERYDADVVDPHVDDRDAPSGRPVPRRKGRRQEVVIDEVAETLRMHEHGLPRIRRRRARPERGEPRGVPEARRGVVGDGDEGASHPHRPRSASERHEFASVFRGLQPRRENRESEAQDEDQCSHWFLRYRQGICRSERSFTAAARGHNCLVLSITDARAFHNS